MLRDFHGAWIDAWRQFREAPIVQETWSKRVTRYAIVNGISIGLMFFGMFLLEAKELPFFQTLVGAVSLGFAGVICGSRYSGWKMRRRPGEVA